jgi:TetR/AcrR family transcriptional regulator, tetracycline repressor protein
MVAPPNRRRARRGALTEERIVNAALAVMARDGLAGVGMRSVARQLRTPPMSLYRHVRDQRALIELLRQRVTEQPSVPQIEGPWARRLTALLVSARTLLRRHQGAAALFDSQTFERPGAFFPVELALEALSEAGLGPAVAASTAASLWSYVVGSVVAEQAQVAAWPGAELTAAKRPGWADRMRSTTDGRAPRVVSALAVWASLDHEAVFARGLELMLLGVAAEARRHRRTGTAP